MDSSTDTIILSYIRYVLCFTDSNTYYVSRWKTNVDNVLYAKHFLSEKSAAAAVKRLHKQDINCYYFAIRITVEPI